MKPGIRTTEFWGKSILQLVVLLNVLFDLGIQMDEQTALLIAGGLEAIYTTWRSALKRGTEKTP